MALWRALERHASEAHERRDGIMSEGWRTLPQLARELDVAESTARRWAKAFARYLPSKGRGAARRYAPEAKAVLARVKELFDAGLTTQQVEEALRASFSATLDVVPTADAPPPAPAVPNPVLEILRKQAEELEALRAEVAAMRETQERLLTRQEERDRALMEVMRALQEQRRPWWQRWRKGG